MVANLRSTHALAWYEVGCWCGPQRGRTGGSGEESRQCAHIRACPCGCCGRSAGMSGGQRGGPDPDSTFAPYAARQRGSALLQPGASLCAHPACSISAVGAGDGVSLTTPCSLRATGPRRQPPAPSSQWECLAGWRAPAFRGQPSRAPARIGSGGGLLRGIGKAASISSLTTMAGW